ncbi:hypothetical protein F4802DRAFT_562044 [Xylaria palmicola]|nr:hypothetical protein F4802DRAFT_562044 [Xylaria palmicola]
MLVRNGSTLHTNLRTSNFNRIQYTNPSGKHLLLLNTLLPIVFIQISPTPSNMSSKIVEDVKTGVKGIRGAGDALRGNLMGAADQAFDSNQNHPETQASELKNQTIADKGKKDMQAVDERLAGREQEREARKLNQPGFGLAENGAGAAKGTGHHPLPLQ